LLSLRRSLVDVCSGDGRVSKIRAAHRSVQMQVLLLLRRKLQWELLGWSLRLGSSRCAVWCRCRCFGGAVAGAGGARGEEGTKVRGSRDICTVAGHGGRNKQNTNKKEKNKSHNISLL